MDPPQVSSPWSLHPAQGGVFIRADATTSSCGDEGGFNILLCCSGTDSGDKKSTVGVAQTLVSSWWCPGSSAAAAAVEGSVIPTFFITYPLLSHLLLIQPPSAWAEPPSSPAVLHSRVLGWSSRVPQQTLGCACAPAETQSANTTDRAESREHAQRHSEEFTGWMKVFLCWSQHSLGMLSGEQGNE